MGFFLHLCGFDCNDQTCVTTDTDLSAYLGKIITFEEGGQSCWLVENENDGSGPEITLTNCYNDCETCQKVAYQLTDCIGRLLPKYSTQEELGDLGGFGDRVIKIPYYDNACFTVTIIQYDPLLEYEHVTYSNVYDTCVECAHRKAPEPLYTLLCNPDYVEKVKCKFGEIIYQDLQRKKFDLKECCPKDDYTKWQLKNQILDNNLIKHPSPPLPEPIVLACCIDTSPAGPVGFDLNCPCPDPPVMPCPCNCLASVDGPHDCHLYSVDVVAEMLADATGNTDTTLDNKVFFGYFACGETTVTTVPFTAIDTQEYCVLGIPRFGWFKDDEWVEFDTIPEGVLVRGEVCEVPELDENDCNNCNECN